MTSEEFRVLLQQRSDLELLDPCLHDDRTPYVFQPRPAAWDAFRREIVLGIGVASGDIRIVGSGRFGFSMKPGRDLKSFDDKSDIDVVVVNAELFDRIWLALLQAAYPRRPITTQLGGWLNRARNELYTGWLTPREIRLDGKIFGVKAKPVLDFRALWFNTLKKASRQPARRHEDVTGRLYRTWRHAELYHLNSLAALRKDLSRMRIIQ